MSSLGWIGSFLLAFCGLPELCKSLKSRRCALSYSFLLMWGLGEILVLIPVIGQALGTWLIFNYSANLIIIAWLLLIKIKENKSNKGE